MIVWLVIVVVFLCFSAFFAFSETSIFSIPREKYEILKNEKGGGKQIYEILMKSNLFLVFLLLGNNFVNIVIITGLEKVLGTYLTDNLALIFFLTTAILLVVGEITPKVIAVGNPMPIARFVAAPITFILKYFGGFFNVINSFNLYILRANYRYLLQTPDPFVTSEEYTIAVNEAVSTKKISESAGEMITSFLDLSEDSIMQIARNRNSLKIIKENTQPNQMQADEIAVFYESSGAVKEVYYCSFNKIIKKIAPVWFPTTKTLGDLHNYFLKTGFDCVLLVDEYGDFFGAVSRYDIYKYWQAFCGGGGCQSGENLEHLSEITADASSEVVKFQDWFSDDTIEEYGDAKTLNGILCSIFGKIPQIGDRFSESGFVYEIIDADKTKIKKVKIERNPN